MNTEHLNNITSTAKQILSTIPSNVTLVAAAKTRSAEEAKAVLDAGIKILGYNYMQEAEQIHDRIGETAEWHMIGHLQRNKVKKAVQIFDMIQTIDSVRLAEEVSKQCAANHKTMPILIEINSGKESNKTGVLPEKAEELIRQISTLTNLSVQGLMTMGPLSGNPEDSRPYFRETKHLFDRIKQKGIPQVQMQYLSMGMSDSYQIAIEEGANMVRIGTLLFGERIYH